MTEQPNEAVKREKEEELAAALRSTCAPALQPTCGWRLVSEATAFVTHATLNVCTGTKHGGPDTVGQYTRLSGCDPALTLTVEIA
jgi:hypothetical protein